MGKSININLYSIKGRIWWNNSVDRGGTSYCITMSKGIYELFKMFYHYHKGQSFISRFEYSIKDGAWSRFKEYKYN